MRNDQAKTIQRRDYTPPEFLVDDIELEFDLDPDGTRVRALSRMRRRDGGSGPCVLDGDGLELVSIAIDGRALADGEYRVRGDRLEIDAPPERFVLEVVTLLKPAQNTSLMGLYVSNGNYFTQCEAEGFRRITWFPDRPDVMARYRVTLRANPETCPVLLANGNLISDGPCAPGPDGSPRHQAVWEDPFPKPSYLFAVVAGRLVAREEHLTTMSGRRVLLQVWVEPGNEDKTGHAMQSLVRSIRWDEQRFGLELDLDRFMIVAVSDFNMGAMENKGLNIFNTKYVLANSATATDTDFANIESVVAHEYFHNWTGNRVTCRDWFQLTLKEGLTVFRDQEFSADKMAEGSVSDAAAASARAVKRIEDVRVLRSAQFPEDAGPMAHPIRPDAYQEINNFYTVTVYEKGAEVVRMLQTLVGREGFRRGIDLYFQRHDGQAVTCDDFVAAIADANGRDLSQFRHWYAQAGTPRLTVLATHDAAARRLVLDVEQHAPAVAGTSDSVDLVTGDAAADDPATSDSPAGNPANAPFHIPLAIGLVGPDGRDLPLRLAGEGEGEAGACTRVLDVTRHHQRFVFENVAQPPVPSLLRDFSAPVIVDYPYTEAQLAFLMSHDSDPFNRWEAAQRLAQATVIASLAGSGDAPVLRDTLTAAFARVLDDDALDPAFKELLLTMPGESVIAEQLDAVDPGRVREARNALRVHLAATLAERWERTRAQCEPDGPYRPDPASAGRRALRNVALGYLVAGGVGDAWQRAAQQFHQTDNMTDRQAALAALVNSRAPQREDVLERFARDFADEPLAMDKWFMVQATMHRQLGDAPVIERVRRLLDHPAFSIRNPNKVRALIGNFCNANPAEFHDAGGDGYRFWETQIARLDPLNPQVAARVARALDRWRKYTPERQTLMRASLRRVAALPDLSGDVREIVTKALDEHANTNA